MIFILQTQSFRAAGRFHQCICVFNWWVGQKSTFYVMIFTFRHVPSSSATSVTVNVISDSVNKMAPPLPVELCCSQSCSQKKHYEDSGGVSRNCKIFLPFEIPDFCLTAIWCVNRSASMVFSLSSWLNQEAVFLLEHLLCCLFVPSHCTTFSLWLQLQIQGNKHE